MRMVLALMALLSVAGMGRAGEKEIIERLEKKGKCAHWSLGGNFPINRLALVDGFDDTDLSELCDLRDLWTVELHGPGFTDAGLRQLEGLDALLKVKLLQCPNVTAAGVARLQKALPNCNILR
jgi:hypothetical protein